MTAAAALARFVENMMVLGYRREDLELRVSARAMIMLACECGDRCVYAVDPKKTPAIREARVSGMVIRVAKEKKR